MSPTPALRRLLSGALMLSLLLPWSLQAQVFPRGNGIVLGNINQLDLYVDVSRLTEIPGADPVEFRLGSQRLLEESLAARGISRRPSNRLYLVCSVEATEAGAQLAYATNVELWERQSTDVHSLLWRRSAIATIDAGQFRAELLAATCADQFLGEWSRWNEK